MEFIRRKISLVSMFMVTLMLSITVPYQPLLAAMVPTDAIVDSYTAEEGRDYLKSIIFRDDIRKSLISHGIYPNEAKARVDSLSDSEAIAVVNRIEKLPAGGNGIGVIVGAVLIIFLVLLLTDILGYTDVFPFVKAQNK